jgi:hypothetical protein
MVRLTVTHGCLTVERWDWKMRDQTSDWEFFHSWTRRDQFGWAWRPSTQVAATVPTITITWVPLYIPFTLLALPTAWIFYRDRRSVRWRREGRCLGCGYDLSGVSGKCPECGREAA